MVRYDDDQSWSCQTIHVFNLFFIFALDALASRGHSLSTSSLLSRCARSNFYIDKPVYDSPRRPAESPSIAEICGFRNAFLLGLMNCARILALIKLQTKRRTHLRINS